MYREKCLLVIFCKIGGNILFQCRVLSGIPNPTIEWRPLNGENFGENVEILVDGGVIRITDVQTSNGGRATRCGYFTAKFWL